MAETGGEFLVMHVRRFAFALVLHFIHDIV